MGESKWHIWFDKYVRNPLAFNRPLPRLIGVTIINRSTKNPEYRYWNILAVAMPGEADSLWKNGLVSLYVHLPFGVSLSVRLPVPYGGRLFGYTLQTGIGWKGYNGYPFATLRIQNDEHEDYHNPDGPVVGRAKGLDEGNV